MKLYLTLISIIIPHVIVFRVPRRTSTETSVGSKPALTARPTAVSSNSDLDEEIADSPLHALPSQSHLNTSGLDGWPDLGTPVNACRVGRGFQALYCTVQCVSSLATHLPNTDQYARCMQNITKEHIQYRGWFRAGSGSR